MDTQGQPVPERGGGRRVAGSDVPPQLQRAPEIDLDEIQESIEVEVRQGRTATQIEAEDACHVGALLERSIGLAQEQVARVLLGEVGLLAYVALGYEEIHESVIVDVIELRVPGRRRKRLAAGERAIRQNAAFQPDVAVGR